MNPYGKRPDEPEPLEEVDDFPEERRRPYRSESRRSRYADEERERTSWAREREDFAPRRRPARRRGPGLAMILGVLAILLVVGGIVGAIIYAVHLSTSGERIPEQDWSTFRPSDGRCSIQMPGKPECSRIMAIDPVTKYVVERNNEHSAFALAFCDYPQPNDQALLTMLDRVNTEINNIKELAKGKVVKDKDITLGRLSGREVHIRKGGGDGLIILRFYYEFVRGFRRTYMLSVEGSYIKPDQGDAARFFNSFQIDELPAPPQPQPGLRPPVPQDPPPLRPAEPGPIRPRPPGPEPIRPRPPITPQVEPGLEDGPIVGGTSTEDAAPLPPGLRPSVDDSKKKKIYLADLEKVEVGPSPPGWKYGRKGHLGNGRRRIQAAGWTSYKGLSMHPPGEPSFMRYPIPESEWFVGWAGINDSADFPCRGGLTFAVIGDGKILWRSRPVDRSQWFQECRVSVKGVKQLELRAFPADGSTNVPTHGHAVWLDPYLIPASE